MVSEDWTLGEFGDERLTKTYGPPRPQECLFGWQLTGLHQHIRHSGRAVAKMESRTSRAS